VLAFADGQAEQVALPPGTYDSPTWLSDGRLAFIRSWAGPGVDDSAIGIVSQSSSPVAHADAIDPEGIQEYLTAHPKQPLLAFTTTFALAGNRYRWGLFRWTVGSKQVETLLEVEGAPIEADWSPDGAVLAFSWDRSGLQSVWTLPATGDAPRALYAAEDGVRTPRWSPDGKAVVAVEAPGTARSKLVIVDVRSGTTRCLMPFSDQRPCRDPDWGP
jgi:dipeptidyl aminopeptidase/acylaminoacyl peptidase